jgi:pimeloyl-ACP methyl ester carboxylesterase
MTIQQRTTQVPARSQPDVSRAMPEVAGVAHRYVDTGRLGVHVAEAGSGPPLLLLHGWPQHWCAWRELIPLLAGSWRLICTPQHRQPAGPSGPPFRPRQA